MDGHGRVIARTAQQRDQPLRLAQRVGAHQMRPLRKGAERAQQPFHFVLRARMAEDGQAERRLGDEDVAGDGLEGRAGGIRRALVVARDHHAQAVRLDNGLRAAQDMPRRHEAQADAADTQHFAIGRGLGAAGEALAIARCHDGQRFRRRQHRPVAAAGVVGMAVGDDGARHRPHRVDVEIARRAVEPLGTGGEHILGCGHERYLGSWFAHVALLHSPSRPLCPSWFTTTDTGITKPG